MALCLKYRFYISRNCSLEHLIFLISHCVTHPHQRQKAISFLPPQLPNSDIEVHPVSLSRRILSLIYGYLYSHGASCHPWRVLAVQPTVRKWRVGGRGTQDRVEEGTAETGRVERDRFVTDCCCLDLTVSESGNLDAVCLYACFDRLKEINSKEIKCVVYHAICVWGRLIYPNLSKRESFKT